MRRARKAGLSATPALRFPRVHAPADVFSGRRDGAVRAAACIDAAGALGYGEGPHLARSGGLRGALVGPSARARLRWPPVDDLGQLDVSFRGVAGPLLRRAGARLPPRPAAAVYDRRATPAALDHRAGHGGAGCILPANQPVVRPLAGPASRALARTRRAAASRSSCGSLPSPTRASAVSSRSRSSLPSRISSLTRWWQKIGKAATFLLLPFGQNALYCYTVHIFFALAALFAAARFGLPKDNLWVSGLIQLAAVAITWQLARSRFLLATARTQKYWQLVPLAQAGILLIVFSLPL